MTNHTPHGLAKSCSKLASFPDVAFRIDDLLEDENSGAEEFTALIQTDPALSAALLRIANSAMYGVPGGVSSIDKAVSVVGLREVRNLAFGICTTEAFHGISNELISLEDFWRHSLYCAVAAQQIAKSAKVCRGESLFTAGLLHDIGQLVMYNQAPELSQQALELSLDDNDSQSPYLSERKLFGFDHMDVGEALARQWELPIFLQETIRYHHAPFLNENCSDATMVVHIANSVAVLAELDSNDFSDAPEIDERVFAQLLITPENVLDAISPIKESASELLRVFIN